MLTFIADETAVQGKDGQPYGLSIYGGLILKEADFKELTDFLYKLKGSYFLPQELDLKWRFESVWENMRKLGPIAKEVTKQTHPDLYNSYKEDYNKLKESILDKISESKAKIVLAIRPNKLLGASDEQIVNYSIGALVRKFEKVLEREGGVGIILADELPKRLRNDDKIDYQYILNLCHTSSNSLISIVPTIDSCISPLHQINDIVLGAMQYYMLEFIRKLHDGTHNTDAAKKLFGKIVGNFYESTTGGYVINNGILLYPPKNNRINTPAGIFLNKLESQLETDFNIR